MHAPRCADARAPRANPDLDQADARSLCEGYNRGVAMSRGDVLIFSDDDIEIPTRDLCARLLRHIFRG